MKVCFGYCTLTAAASLLVGVCSTGFCASQATDPAAESINALGLDLLRQASKPDANALFSPYSIQTGLAMTYGGADGVTRNEMAKVLHYSDDELALHLSFAALRQELEALAQRSEQSAQAARQAGAEVDSIALSMANRLFGQTNCNFREPFKSLLKENYDAPFEEVDFRRSPEAAAKRINDWIAAQTRGRICNLIPGGELDDYSRLLLVNAIHLKAPWAAAFRPLATQPAPFHVNGGDAVDVPMMTLQTRLRYAQGNGFTSVELPYKGEQLRFLILLPAAIDGLASLEAKLSPDMLAGRLQWQERLIELYLPKFAYERPLLRLGKILQSLGMKTAFDQDQANFERIAPRGNLYLSEVFHKTLIRVDEKGTEASAASAAYIRYGGISSKPSEPLYLRVDHPFIFAVIHQPSRACLFLGHVTDPR